MTPQQFKAARHALGHTQIEMAAHLGVSRRTIQNWEAGTAPIPQSVAMALGVPS